MGGRFLMSRASSVIREWRENPCKFVWDHFGVEPDHWQKEGLEAFASGDEDKKRICLAACAGPGKSALLAWAGWNFLSCYGEPGEHPKGAAVSVSSDNLRDNLWAEMSKWQERSQFLSESFTWTRTRIFAKDHESTWFMAARAFSKTANQEEVGRTLAGLHSKYVLYLIDESGDIPPSIVRSAEQGLSTGPKFGKILQAGNPTSHDGMLYAASNHLSHQWYTIRITGDPEDPKRSNRIDPVWAAEQIENYGRDNPWVMAYILGKFPPTSINTLLGPDEVRNAMNRRVKELGYQYSQKRLGVDVARFGDDRTIIFPRQGLMSYKWVEMRAARQTDIAARVIMAKTKWDSVVEFIDGTGGYGAGVIDIMLQAGHSPHEIQFAGKAIDPRYKNKRAEMWFNMAEWIKRGGSLPKDERLIKELTAPTYSFQNGKFILEPKEKIKDRLGFSPDIADALALTFALPEMANPTEMDIYREKMFGSVGKLKTDFDPVDY
jgi:hypothetical protein